VCITNNCEACEALETGNCLSKDCIYRVAQKKPATCVFGNYSPRVAVIPLII